MSNPHPLNHPTHSPVIIYKQDALFSLTFLLFLLLRHISSSEWTWAAYAAEDDLERLILDSVSQVRGLQMPGTTTIHLYGTSGPQGLIHAWKARYQLSYIPALHEALTAWKYVSTLKSSSWFLGFLSHMMRIMFVVTDSQGHNETSSEKQTTECDPTRGCRETWNIVSPLLPKAKQFSREKIKVHQRQGRLLER